MLVDEGGVYCTAFNLHMQFLTLAVAFQEILKNFL